MDRMKARRRRSRKTSSAWPRRSICCTPEGSKSLLVVLQALDAGGKDGVVRHVFTAMNPQETLVSSFATPSVARRCAVDSCGDRRRQTQARSVGPAW